MTFEEDYLKRRLLCCKYRCGRHLLRDPATYFEDLLGISPKAQSLCVLESGYVNPRDGDPEVPTFLSKDSPTSRAKYFKTCLHQAEIIGHGCPFAIENFR